MTNPSIEFARLQRASVCLEMAFATKDLEAFQSLSKTIQGTLSNITDLFVTKELNNGKETKPYNQTSTSANSPEQSRDKAE